MGLKNVQELVNLLLLRGAMGKPGAGACPVRGHSNVQGDRTVGIWEKLKPEFGKRLREVYGFVPPSKTGYSAVEAAEAMHQGRVGVFVAMGGNFVGAMPDTEYMQQAMGRCALTVSVATKLNPSHVFCGQTGIILPCLGRSEMDDTGAKTQFVTTENSTGVVQRSQGVLPPCSVHLKSEVQIVADLACATLGAQSRVPWEVYAADYDTIRDAIESTIPGFESYNSRVREASGFYLPNGPRQRQFTNEAKKALFTVNAVPAHALGEGQLLLTSIRSHDQYNTTVYGMDDRYRGVYGSRHVLFMNVEDMQRLGLCAEQTVTVVNEDADTVRRASGFRIVAYPIPRGCVAAYFPEINVIIPRGRVDRYSQTPASKSIRVRLEP